MNGCYLEPIRESLRMAIADYPNWGDRREVLIDLYALLVMAKGEHTTMEDVHNAWSFWTEAVDPTHKSLVPFGSLTNDIAEYDRPYMKAIHDVARVFYGPAQPSNG